MIFKDAKFGDKFIDNSGKILIYHYCKKYTASDGKDWLYHYLMREPECTGTLGFLYAPYGSYVDIDEIGVPTNLKYCNIEDIKRGPNGPYLITKKYIEDTILDLRGFCDRLDCILNDSGRCNMWSDISMPENVEDCDNYECTV